MDYRGLLRNGHRKCTGVWAPHNWRNRRPLTSAVVATTSSFSAYGRASDLKRFPVVAFVAIRLPESRQPFHPIDSSDLDVGVVLYLQGAEVEPLGALIIGMIEAAVTWSRRKPGGCHGKARTARPIKSIPAATTTRSRIIHPVGTISPTAYSA